MTSENSSLRNFFDHPDTGKLILRISMGVTMVIQGIPKYLGGKESLENVGSAMAVYGLDFFPVFWGFMAATTEALGGVLIIIGLFYRPTMVLLTFTMLTATFIMLPAGGYFENFNDYAYPMNLFFVFLGMLMIGPGQFKVRI